MKTLLAILLSCSLSHLLPFSASAQQLRAAGRIATTTATNLWSAYAQPATVFTITVYNSGSSDLYLHVFDTNGVPGAGAVPTLTPLSIPSNKTGGWDFNVAGCRFANGIVIATSSTSVTLTNGGAVFVPTVTFNP